MNDVMRAPANCFGGFETGVTITMTFALPK
jgi:hypothetical protein